MTTYWVRVRDRATGQQSTATFDSLILRDLYLARIGTSADLIEEGVSAPADMPASAPAFERTDRRDTKTLA